MTTESKNMTASDVEAILAKLYCQPEHAIFFGCPDATGGRHVRTADAVAMSLWPSRGFALHAFEIKVSRYDWTQNEMKNPGKAERFYELCDFFWMVTPEGIIKEGELPMYWGHIVVYPDGTHKTMVQAKEKILPDKKRAGIIPRDFCAAIFRRAHLQAESRAVQLIQDKIKEAKLAAEREFESELRRRTPEAYKDLKEKYDALVTGMGFKPEDMKWTPTSEHEHIAGVYKLLKHGGVTTQWGGVDNLLKTLGDVQEKLLKAMEQFAPVMGINNMKEHFYGKKKK